MTKTFGDQILGEPPSPATPHGDRQWLEKIQVPVKVKDKTRIRTKIEVQVEVAVEVEVKRTAVGSEQEKKYLTDQSLGEGHLARQQQLSKQVERHSRFSFHNSTCNSNCNNRTCNSRICNNRSSNCTSSTLQRPEEHKQQDHQPPTQELHQWAHKA
ncbi:hypothetical protein BGZ70_005825 [Mortierella alpina]|uniref:Uncharacterized protein n=1 Tax=Mortierella alpina TaxID=64518 RepID=A0A9P6J8P1_MORAP|nr:hypothetical protein BGZ70_005825 [Mortierella alpina]